MAVTEISPPEEAKLIDIKTVARILGCSDRHIVNMDKAGRMLSPIRFGRSVKWNRAELELWIDSGCPHRSVWESRD